MGFHIPCVFGTANQESEDGEAILFISPCCYCKKKKKKTVLLIILALEVSSKIKSHKYNTKTPFQKYP